MSELRGYVPLKVGGGGEAFPKSPKRGARKYEVIIWNDLLKACWLTRRSRSVFYFLESIFPCIKLFIYLSISLSIYLSTYLYTSIYLTSSPLPECVWWDNWKISRMTLYFVLGWRGPDLCKSTIVSRSKQKI